MKIQITGPTDVTGDNARYTLEVSELTPGDYTLLAGAWGQSSTALTHLGLTVQASQPSGPDPSYYRQTPVLLDGYYVRHVVNNNDAIPHGEPQRDQAQVRWIQYHPWGGPWIPARPTVPDVPYVNFDQYRSLEGGLDLSN